MKISDLELFLKIVREGSLNKTAEKNFITEAAVSQQLKKIEDEAGCALFYRQKGKKLALTDKGTAFLQMAQDIVQRYTAWESLSRQKNSIKIGVSIRQSQTAIEALRQEAPDFSPSRYIFIETTHQERENMVESGELDLAFTSLPLDSRRLKYIVVNRVPMGIYLRKGHPMEKNARRKEGVHYPLLSSEVLKTEGFLLPGEAMPHQRTLALAIFKKYQIEPHISGTFQALSYGAMMAEEGVSSSVSVALPENDSRFYLIDGCNIFYEMAVAYQAVRERDPEITGIIKSFRRYFGKSSCFPSIS